jgi:hypothetical protein
VKTLVAGRLRTLWLGVALSLVLGNGAVLAAGGRAGGAAQTVPLEMAFRDGDLTATIVAAPLGEVMAEISRLTGAEVHWLSQHGAERVSLHLTAVPLHEALGKILQNNFTLSYGPSGILTDVWILARSNGETPAAGLPSAAVADRLIAAQGGVIPAGRNQPSPRMELGVGIDDVPGASSAEIDLDKQPLALRLETVESLAMHADTDEAAREILAHVASTDGDPQVREIASMALMGLK